MTPLRDANGRFVSSGGSGGGGGARGGGGRGAVGLKIRTRLDVQRLLRAKKRSEITTLPRVGAYVRTTMKRKIGSRKSPRGPGSPMTSKTGRARRSILYAVLKARGSVIIGPSARFVGRSAAAHEHGKKYKGDHFKARPFATPTLESSIPKLGPLWRGSMR